MNQNTIILFIFSYTKKNFNSHGQRKVSSKEDNININEHNKRIFVYFLKCSFKLIFFLKNNTLINLIEKPMA